MQKTVVYRGIGFFGTLTIVLIILKLTGLASISWWLIAATFFFWPLLGLTVFVLACIAYVVLITLAFITDTIQESRRAKWNKKRRGKALMDRFNGK